MKFLRILLTSIMMITAVPAAESREPEIRVAVLKSVNTFIVSVRGTYEIIDLMDKTTLIKGRTLKRSRVGISNGGITVGGKFFATKKLRIVSPKDVTVYSETKKGRFRGAIDIQIDQKNNLLVINRLGIESYVKGVLFHEISDKWPIEATKAQAVATRTYALYKMYENIKEPYDVTSDIFSQVYGGRTAERFRTDIAADYTAGEVLVYNGKIIPAFFHSNSGGQTEDANQVWGIDLPPLKGVPSPYSQGMPHYVWKRNFQSSEVQKMLEKAGINVGVIKDISVAERNESGRIKSLIIEARDGRKTKISGLKFRDTLGPNFIKSNKYNVVMKGYFFDLVGNGWGHGVGMCQWGAYQMAKNKFKYDQILKHYYPGVEIKKFEIGQ